MILDKFEVFTFKPTGLDFNKPVPSNLIHKTIFLKFITKDGLIGYGEPSPYNSNPDELIKLIRNIVENFILKKNCNDFYKFRTLIKKKYSKDKSLTASAIAAITHCIIDIKSKKDTVSFFPYMIIKDTLAVCVMGVIISVVIFFGPNLMAEVDNYIPANPMANPSHIVAYWYLAPFYAILRAIPDKLGGVVLMFGAILVLFFIPWLDRSKIRSCSYRPIYKWFMMLFFVNFFILGYVGMKPAEGLYLLIARIGLVYYFVFFLIISPLIHRIEKPKKLPASISEVYTASKS